MYLAVKAKYMTPENPVHKHLSKQWDHLVARQTLVSREFVNADIKQAEITYALKNPRLTEDGREALHEERGRVSQRRDLVDKNFNHRPGKDV